MRITRLTLAAYGRCRDVTVDIGDGVTVVLGANEAGKSTSLDALSDFLWGIPARTARAAECPRAQLRIDAVLAGDGEPYTMVRKANGLFDGDLVTPLQAPWNPENRLSAQWWRTRLGFNHEDLRRGGDAVFAGSGDLADIIFAAREGRSAREVLDDITDQADKLFKSDGRSKKVHLRVAAGAYKRAVTDRDGLLTRADGVVEQRRVVQELQDKHRRLRDEVTATALEVKVAEENLRVIGNVLAFGQATRELELIDDEGDRLTPSELVDYDRAGDERRRAQQRATKLDDDIASITAAVEALSIDDGLLDDRETFTRLNSEVKVRIEGLRRAGEEFAPAVADAATKLRGLLRSIGIDEVDDIDSAVAEARVREDHAATLDALADEIDALEDKRREARDRHDTAVAALLSKGVTVDVAASEPPAEEALAKRRAELVGARDAERTARTLHAEAAETVRNMQSDTAAAHSGAALTHDAVVDARRSRDDQWHTIRRSWVTGELPGADERVDLAAELDARVVSADRCSDDEAIERSRIAALDARAEMQVEGLEAARQKELEAASTLAVAAEDTGRATDEWAQLWAGLGITSVPDVDSSGTVAELLTTAHVAHARVRSLTEQLSDLDVSWCAAAELAGLPVTTTTAAWHRRSQVLEEILAVDEQRAKSLQGEQQARGAWETFLAEAVELLRRHRVLDDDQQLTPTLIEQGFTRLGRELESATTAQGKRSTYLEQLEGLRTERAEVLQAQQAASAELQRLIDIHGLATEQDLGVLVDRALRAAEPLERRDESAKAIKNGLDSGSDFHHVVDRLAGRDEVTIGQELADARLRAEEAGRAADDMLSRCTSARDELRNLEAAAGAAAAEAEVADRQAEVADLAERWAILALQRKLLETILDGLGAGDTRPLLDHAGRLLERLTGGRWVALRAEDDGAVRTLRVIRSDNTPCDTAALSEGTADQVFFALRLAAVAELHRERTDAGEEALPLVLDDVLMAFDEDRVRGALQILTTLAPGLQIIVLTHHQHVAEAAADVGGITVSELPAPASISDSLDGELIRARASRPTG